MGTVKSLSITKWTLSLMRYLNKLFHYEWIFYFSDHEDIHEIVFFHLNPLPQRLNSPETIFLIYRDIL